MRCGLGGRGDNIGFCRVLYSIKKSCFRFILDFRDSSF